MAKNKPDFLEGNKGGGKPMHPPYDNRNDNQPKGEALHNKDTVVEGGKNFMESLPVGKAAAKEKKPFGKMAEPKGGDLSGVGSVGDVD